MGKQALSRHAILATLLALASCVIDPLSIDDSLSVDPDPSASLQTADAQYRLRKVSRGVQVEIPFAYTNSNPDTVYLVNCNRIVAPSLQKREGNNWIQAWSPILPACLSPPIVIPPGASFTDTLGVFAGDRGENIAPQFAVSEIRGVYRLMLYNAVFHYNDRRAGFGDTLSIARRVSNTFVIQEP